jgi:hypothetical protein
MRLIRVRHAGNARRMRTPVRTSSSGQYRPFLHELRGPLPNGREREATPPGGSRFRVIESNLADLADRVAFYPQRGVRSVRSDDDSSGRLPNPTEVSRTPSTASRRKIVTVALAEKEQLLERTEEIEENLDQMKLSQPLTEAPTNTERQAAYRENYRGVMNAILDLCHVLPEGTADYEARRLLEFLVALNSAITDDVDGTDAQGRIELTRIRMHDVVKRMERRIQHSALDNPQEAARFVLWKFADLKDGEVAELLGISTKTLSAWRAGRPIRNQVPRLTNLAQIVSYLQHSMTARGIALWLYSAQDHLDGRTPLDTLISGLEQPDASAVDAVKSLARGGRGQLAD